MQNNPYIEQNTLPAVNPYINQTQPLIDQSSLLGTFDTQKFLLGALIGAVGAYVLTNENAQKAIFKTVAKGSSMLTAGIEEMKERFEDAKAEMEAQAQENS